MQRAMSKALVMLLFLMLSVIATQAQEKKLVQIKTFDQKLHALPNMAVSINGGDYLEIGNKGLAFAELPVNDLPPTSVKIKNDELEAESWNYTKGILEIIIRKKSYKLVQVTVRSTEGKPVSNAEVTFKGNKEVKTKTNQNGIIQIPLYLDEKLNNEGQFKIEGYKIVKATLNDKENVLTARSLTTDATAQNDKDKLKQQEKYFQNFDLKNLDSIRSLTVFYAVFKNYEIAKLDPEIRQKIDRKFEQLTQVYQDSLRTAEKRYILRISDSTFVATDVDNLLSQARQENQTLDALRDDFDKKIALIREKLSVNQKLTLEERKKLLNDMNLLELILRQNEEKFYKNMYDYRAILASLKESYFDTQNLEEKLLQSESQRMEEREKFKKQIFTILLVAFVLGFLILLFVYLSIKLKKQQKELLHANNEIKRINENLESLVRERTKLLEEAHHEMDIFLYRASHDLRSPICSIIGLCNIAMHMTDVDKNELFEKVLYTATRMDKMLKKLRVISEINQPSNYGEIFLLNEIQKVTSQFNEFIEANHIQLTIDCDGDLCFNSFPSLIETILYNLVDNALFFSAIKRNNNAKIRIKAYAENNNIIISVYDNGIGIGNEVREKLWNMFFVGHELSKGNGLGLYIVQKSVQALQGTIVVESEKNTYAQFIVTLPVQLTINQTAQVVNRDLVLLN